MHLSGALLRQERLRAQGLLGQRHACPDGVLKLMFC